MPQLSPQALALLRVQANVIASWQPAAPSARAMRRAVGLGQWHEMTSRTFYASPAGPGEEQYLWAAALHCGPHSMLSGQAGLKGHGWTGERRGPLDVLIPMDSRCRTNPPWMSVHRTTFMPRSSRHGIPRASIGASLVDAAAWASSDQEAQFIVISVLQQKLVSAQQVRAELRDRPVVKRRSAVLQVTDEFDLGITSMNELRFARLCREYGIREPDRQVWRRDGRRRPRRLDVYWDAEGVVVEIDGVGHLDPATKADDDFRQNSIVLGGDTVFLRVSTQVLRHEPEGFMPQLLEALEQGRAKCAS